MIGDNLLPYPNYISEARNLLRQFGFILTMDHYKDLENANKLVGLNNEVYEKLSWYKDRFTNLQMEHSELIVKINKKRPPTV